MFSNPRLVRRKNCPGIMELPTNRRQFLRHTGMGFGWLAMQGLLTKWGLAEAAKTHFPSKARNVIFLFMDGGVSHVDTFDPKPELVKQHGKPAKWRTDARSQAVSANRK